MRFRIALASEIGIDLYGMEGFDGKNSWSSVKDDPINAFLNHSDCEDFLSPLECLLIAPRLRELTKNWEDAYDKENALLLADNMEECSRLNVNLIFC